MDGSHWSLCALGMWPNTLAFLDGCLATNSRSDAGIVLFVCKLIMSPATKTGDSDFGDGGGLQKLVLARGIEASFGASLDEHRVNDFLSELCFVFVEIPREKVAVFVFA